MYHPAFDLNHCLYRIIAILVGLKSKKITWDRLRVLDFYYLFPSQIKKIRPWPAEFKVYKKSLFSIPDSFEDIPNQARVFYGLLRFQKAVIAELIAREIIVKERFNDGELVVVFDNIPSNLIEALESDDFLLSDTFNFIVNELAEFEFNGSKGLKQRSGLMEYIYDAS